MDRDTLQNYRTSGTTAPLASNMLDGEIAVGMNPDDPKLWFKDSDGNIQEITTKSYNDKTYGTSKVTFIVKNEIDPEKCDNLDTTADYGSEYVNNLVLDSSDAEDLRVIMGGVDVTEYYFNKDTLVIDITKVTGNLNIYIDDSTAVYYTVTKGTCDGVTTTAPSTVKAGTTLRISYTLEDGYELKDDGIKITENGTERTFTLQNDVIYVSNVQGDIIYSIDSAAEHTVTYTFNNVTSTNTATTVSDQDTYTTTLVFDTTTYTSIDVTITVGEEDVTNGVYNKSTQVVTIVNPDGDIVIHAEAVTTLEKTYSDTLDLTQFDWKFNKLRDVSTETFDTSMMETTYSDASWDTVQIPYDWSIYNSFNTSTTGNEYESGWLAGGDAIYRVSVIIPSTYEGNKIYINFDGVYMTSEVYINGTSVGTNKNGYIPFSFEISEYVNFGETNVIAVAVSNHIPSSRWYSGSGIYRKVWISMNNSSKLGDLDVTVTTPNLATEQGGTVTTNVNVALENTSTEITGATVTASIYQEWDGTKVGTSTLTNQTISASDTSSFDLSIGVSNPTLWTTYDVSSTIRLYKVIVEVNYDNTNYTSSDFVFGYRYITYDSTGFYLNGTKTFLKGMCNHHDNGPLGSETYYEASERQIRTLKEMGCNCLRTTHAPQSSIFLECAMRNGFMVIEELFDGWRYAKNSNSYDYARFFSQDNSYIEVVVKNTIKRDKNNPAIIMWSIGNEVDEGCSTSYNAQYVTDGTLINTYVKNYDTTRPTTIGNNKPANTYAMQIMALVDIPGVNYGDDSEYSTLRSASSNGVSFSTKCIYGSETVSPFYTRGIYEVATSSYYYSCFDWSNSEQTSSHATWGDSSCVSLKRHSETYDWLAGTCPWTGFDYIGEPTPANSTGVRSSFFGVVDLCGFKKDAYYMYQSKWTDTPMVHIVPEDWTTWTEGSTVTVWVYSNCNSVKLHLNGTEITSTVTPTTGSHYAYEYSVTYAKGTLVATGYDSESNIIAQDIRFSAGNATSIKLYSDKTQVAKDGLLYIECNILDKYGTLVPRASQSVTFTADGGSVLATDNGFEGCLEDFRNSVQTTFTGKCIAIVKPYSDSNSIKITAESSSLDSYDITIPVGESSIYAEKSSESFCDPTDPPIRASVSAIELSEGSVHFDNGSSATVTVTKTPEGSTDEITAISNVEGITATVDNDNNTVTVTNTVDDVKGTVTIECGGITKTLNVSCGSAVETTCTMMLNGTEYSETNNTIYVEEYLPVSFTSTGSDIASVNSESSLIITYNSTYGVIYGKSTGTTNIIVTNEDGEAFEFSITSSIWTDDSSNTITDNGIKSINSNYYLPTIATYTTATTLSGNIQCMAVDTTATSVVAIMDVATSTTVDTSTSAILDEFGTDYTGQRKAYVVDYTGSAGNDLGCLLAMTDTSNGLHVINVRCGSDSYQYSYKIGTLSCTSITFEETVINITSDAENTKSIKYTVLPEDTTDDLVWSVANNYVTCVGGSLFAIKNGTDTVTLTVGSVSASATVNISNITEDETILAYNAEITGSKQYYAGDSSGIDWNSGYTLYAELKITTITSTANIISFGSNIDSWSGYHYHIYYPSTSNSTTIGNFSDKTTQGICIAMSSGSPTTAGVTTTMKGGQESDTIYLVQNNNGLWVNGVEATDITNSSGSFATIQALTTVQIGSQEGSGRFQGIVKQLRRIKNSDLATAYQTNGLTSTELEDISNNGLTLSTYLAIYEAAATRASEEASTGDDTTVTPMTLANLEAIESGSTVQVVLANPHTSNGYILGYTTATAGYSNSTVSLTSSTGFANEATITSQVQSVVDDADNSQYFVYTLTKTGTDTCTIQLASGYGPTGDTSTVSWGTVAMEYTLSDLTTNALASTTSMSSNYTESYCLRLANPTGYYLNSQGSPNSASYATGTGEWSVWYIYKVD